MEITFDSSSTSTIRYPTPPAEYIFQAGIVKDKSVKKNHKNYSGLVFFIIIVLAMLVYIIFSARN